MAVVMAPPDGITALADWVAALPLGARVLVAERLGEGAGEGFAVALAVVVGEALDADPAGENAAGANVRVADGVPVAQVAQLPPGVVTAPVCALAEAAKDLRTQRKKCENLHSRKEAKSWEYVVTFTYM